MDISEKNRHFGEDPLYTTGSRSRIPRFSAICLVTILTELSRFVLNTKDYGKLYT
jgi:hypothetical protein